MSDQRAITHLLQELEDTHDRIESAVMDVGEQIPDEHEIVDHLHQAQRALEEAMRLIRTFRNRQPDDSAQHWRLATEPLEQLTLDYRLEGS